MSLPRKWVETQAPVADVYERVILLVLAGRADQDGTNAWPSQHTMATSALCDTETVKRRLKKMEQRRLIARGDQRLVAHLRKDRRPVVYDVLIPRSWFSDQQWDELQQEREKRGLAPLDPGARPDIAPAPHRGRKTRTDKGKANPKRSPKKSAVSSENAPSAALTEPPLDDGHGGSNSRGTGALTESSGGSKRATTSFLDRPQGPPPPEAEEEEGSPSGEQTPPGTSSTGAALLRRWARFRPGKFLGEQARAECERLVDEHLAAGVDPDRLGHYLQEWAGQALNPSTWLPMQLRELQLPAGPTSPAPAARPATGDQPASTEQAREAAKAQYAASRQRNRPRRAREGEHAPDRGGSAFDEFLTWTGQQMRQDAEKSA